MHESANEAARLWNPLGLMALALFAGVLMAQEGQLTDQMPALPPGKSRSVEGVKELEQLFVDPTGDRLAEFKRLHPILPHGARDKQRLINDTRSFMALNEATIKALIPEQNAAINCDCPKCGTDKNWKLDFDRPDRLLCTQCKQYYPNETYPENHHQTFNSFFCKPVRVPYHRNAQGKTFCFYGKLNELKFEYLSSFWQAEAVGHAYRYTQDPRYARRMRDVMVGLALNSDRFLFAHEGAYAQLYPWPRDVAPEKAKAMFPEHFKPKPGWNINQDAPFVCWVFPEQQAPYASFINTYDLIYADDCLDEPVIGTGGLTARNLIDVRLLGRMVEYLSAASDAFGDDPHSFNNTGNICSQYMYPGIAARVTGRTRELRFMCHLLLTFPIDRYRITYDRCSLEGPGYHGCWLGGYLISAMHLTTMPGSEGRKIQEIFRRTAAYEELTSCRDRVLFPSGLLPILNDDSRREYPDLPFLQQSTGNILPGFGYAVLGDGTKPMEQIQVHLDFSKMHNHGHHDSLSLQLFAHGREKLTDIGANYTDGSLYNWGASTLSHNTVVVDGLNQNETWGEGGGRLECFSPNLPGLSMVRADSSDLVYARQKVTRYRRTLVMNTVDLSAPYVIDVFEVEGGSTHDYSLHGSCYERFPHSFSASIPMTPMPGERPLLDPGVKWKPATGAFQGIDERQLYGFFRNVQSARLDRDARLEFAFPDQPDSRIISHVKKDPELTLYAGETPALAGRPFWKPLKDLALTRWMPHLLLRRRNLQTRELKSLFVLLHEPVKGVPQITDFDWQEQQGNVNLTVRFRNGRCDDYSLALETPAPRSYGELTTDGILGAAVTMRDRRDAWVIGGTYAKSGGREARLPSGEATGRVLDFGSKRFGDEDHFLLTDAKVPDTPFMTGEVAFVEFLNADGSLKFRNAFEIVTVKKEGVNTKVILRDDPWMNVDQTGVAERYYPYRKAVTCRFRWIASKSTVPSAAIEPSVGRYSPSRPNQYIPFTDRQTVRLIADRPNVPIRVTTDGSTPKDTTPVQSSLSLNGTTTVMAVPVNPEGVMAPRPVTQTFLGPIEAKSADAAGLTPGLRLNLMKKDLKTMLAKGIEALDVQQTFEVGGFETANIGRGVPAVFEGFILIPETGLFTMESDAYPWAGLRIGDQWVIGNASPTGRSHNATYWWFQRVHVPLMKGVHPIRLEYYSESHFAGSIDIHRALSGKPLEEIPLSAFYREAPPAKP